MKIVDAGTWGEVWTAQKKCMTVGCGAILLLEESDVKAVDYSNRGDFYFDCPVCAHSTIMQANEIPPRLVKTLNAKRKHPTGNGRD